MSRVLGRGEVVPVDGDSASVRAGGGEAASVAIPEEAVRRGAELQAPPLPGASR